MDPEEKSTHKRGAWLFESTMPLIKKIRNSTRWTLKTTSGIAWIYGFLFCWNLKVRPGPSIGAGGQGLAQLLLRPSWKRGKFGKAHSSSDPGCFWMFSRHQHFPAIYKAYVFGVYPKNMAKKNYSDDTPYGCFLKWGYPNSWRVFVGENPNFKWMMTGVTPISGNLYIPSGNLTIRYGEWPSSSWFT